MSLALLCGTQTAGARMSRPHSVGDSDEKRRRRNEKARLSTPACMQIKEFKAAAAECGRDSNVLAKVSQ